MFRGGLKLVVGPSKIRTRVLLSPPHNDHTMPQYNIKIYFLQLLSVVIENRFRGTKSSIIINRKWSRDIYVKDSRLQNVLCALQQIRKLDYGKKMVVHLRKNRFLNGNMVKSWLQNFVKGLWNWRIFHPIFRTYFIFFYICFHAPHVAALSP